MGILCEILSAPQNTVMGLNNVTLNSRFNFLIKNLKHFFIFFIVPIFYCIFINQQSRVWRHNLAHVHSNKNTRISNFGIEQILMLWKVTMKVMPLKYQFALKWRTTLLFCDRLCTRTMTFRKLWPTSRREPEDIPIIHALPCVRGCCRA